MWVSAGAEDKIPACYQPLIISGQTLAIAPVRLKSRVHPFIIPPYSVLHFCPKHTIFMKFQGSQKYVATQDLMLAVNAAITLKRPLLVKGEPGTGKTMLAEEVAQALGMPLLQWHIKSTTKAQQGLYEYDAVSRLRDSQLSTVDGGEKVKDINNYIVKGVLWQAFTADEPIALLIDEIDKADIEFPNDLLRNPRAGESQKPSTGVYHL
jgi:DNA polymerase III delta prime subunit